MSERLSKTTTDHNEIRKWAESRGARPACVKKTGGKGDVGMIRLDFPGYSGADSLEHISWEDFNKLISRHTANAADHKSHSGKTSGAGRH